MGGLNPIRPGMGFPPYVFWFLVSSPVGWVLAALACGVLTSFWGDDSTRGIVIGVACVTLLLAAYLAFLTDPRVRGDQACDSANEVFRLIVVATTRDNLWKVREDAVEQMGKLRNPSAVTALINLLTDTSISTSRVLEALIRIADPRGIAAIVEALERGSLGH